MYFFFHLLTGLVIGCLISDLLHDRRWLLPCTVGAVLPDLIDKPVGYFFLAATVGEGRIYAHTLLAAFLILAIGLVFWRTYANPTIFALGTGMLSHEVLDLMWRQPENWFFPFLGSFEGRKPADYLFTLLTRELSNTFDLVIALILGTGLILMILYRRKFAALITNNRQVVSTIATITSFLLCVTAGIIIGSGITGKSQGVAGWSRPEELIIGGIVLALAAYMIWRWNAKMRDKKS